MNKIIVKFHPFSVNQEIYVYINGEVKDSIEVDFSRVVGTVRGYASQYQIDNIELCGNEQYLSKVKKDLLTNFSNSKVNIVNK